MEARTSLDPNTTDPATLFSAFEAMEKAGDFSVSQDEPNPDAQAAADAEAAKAAEAKAAEDAKGKDAATSAAAGTTEKAETTPDGVLAKDGKNVIPYSVLTSARERASAAEAAAQASAERIKALEAQVAGKAPAATTDADPAAAMSDEDLAALEADAPAIAKAMRAQNATIKQLQSQLAEQGRITAEVRTERETRTGNEVQEAIDAVPKLAHIQASNPELFETAKAIDRTFRELPAWKSKSMSARFEAVIKAVENAHGEIVLPNAGQAGKAAADAAAAKAAAAKVAAAENATLTTLSDIPAGTSPVTDEVAAMEAMSTAQVAAKLGSMTPEQMDRFLAGFGA